MEQKVVYLPSLAMTNQLMSRLQSQPQIQSPQETRTCRSHRTCPNLSLVSIAALLILLVVSLMPMTTEAAPAPASLDSTTWADADVLKPTRNEIKSALEESCAYGTALKDTCERCAKITRNDLVFISCCNNKDDVRNWCQNYLSFTIKNLIGTSMA